MYVYFHPSPSTVKCFNVILSNARDVNIIPIFSLGQA